MSEQATARQLMLRVMDDRGNVVVDVDGARFPGTLRDIPTRFVRGNIVEVVLIVGDEPVSLHLRALRHSPFWTPSSPTTSLPMQLQSLTAGATVLTPRAPVSAGVGLAGDLGDVPTAELIQLLCATRRVAQVDLLTERGNVLGSMHFADGRAVRAEAGDVLGEDAFYVLACQLEGRFEVRYGVQADDVNLSGDTLFLLLESARRTDEARRPGDSDVDDDAADDAAMAALSDVAPPLPAVIAPVAAAVEGPALRVIRASEVPAEIAGGNNLPSEGDTPPALPRRRRRATAAAGEKTAPGRRSASQNGLFSGFFEEFQQRQGRTEGRRRASAPTLAENSPVGDALTDGSETPAVVVSDSTRLDDQPAVPQERSEDIVGFHPAFSSLKMQSMPGDPLDRDTDIVERTTISVS